MNIIEKMKEFMDLVDKAKENIDDLSNNITEIQNNELFKLFDLSFYNNSKDIDTLIVDIKENIQRVNYKIKEKNNQLNSLE